MKGETVSRIAASLGISKATVSKALNHCSGVDSDMRARILSAAGSFSWKDTECSVYTLLPDTPAFFWKTMRHGLVDGWTSDVPMKFNVYTRLMDESVINAYLQEAEMLGAQVILAAASMSQPIHQRLAALIKGRLVILLSEDDGTLTNGFFIGSNAWEDGYTMGKLYLTRLAGCTPVVLTLREKHNQNVLRRAEGFCMALTEAGIPAPVQIAVPADFMRTPKTMPARLASLLSHVMPSGEKICLYAAIGYAHIPLALAKAGFTDRTKFMCHDCPLDKSGRLPEGVYASCDQDVYAQGRLAMSAAQHYLITGGDCPAEKRTYIPSVIHFGDGANEKSQA